jgi:hypothetical protein
VIRASCWASMVPSANWSAARSEERRLEGQSHGTVPGAGWLLASCLRPPSTSSRRSRTSASASAEPPGIPAGVKA